MSREIPETPSSAPEIDIERVVIDPDYRREVLGRLHFDRVHHRDKELPVAVMAADVEEP